MNKKNITTKDVLNLAIQQHQKNNFRSAEYLYKEILKKDPNQIDVIFLLSVLLASIKKYDEAIKYFQQVIKINQNYKTINYNLGLVYEELSEYNKAIIYYKKEIKNQPNYIKAYNNLGIVFFKLKEFKKAKIYYEKAIQINKDFKNAHYNLGIVFKELGEYEKAKKCYEEAIKIDKHYGSAHNNLGNIFEILGEKNKAENCYTLAIKSNPNFAVSYLNLGNLYEEIGQYRKAIMFYKQAIKIKFDYVEAYNNLALSFKAIGEIKKAISCYEKIIEHKPDNLISIHYLSEWKKEILKPKLKKKILNIISNNSCSKENQVFGNFLLSKYELKESNYQEEFNYLIKAHNSYSDLKSIFLNKEVDYWLNKLPNTKGLINYNELNKNSKIKNNKIKPIFIVGVPRCGSTLIEKVIASGKKFIPIGEETNIIRDLLKKIINNQQFSNQKMQNLQTQIIEEFNKKNLIDKENNYCFTDKSLDNFFYISFIKKIFPNSKIINCKRNSIHSIMSILKTNLKDVPWGHNLKNILKYIDVYFKIMGNYKKEFPNLIYDLDYEDFVNNPEIESKKLLDFCNLPWDKKCLEFYKRKDIISKTASSFQIKNPIYKDSGDKYLPYKKFLNKYKSQYYWLK